MGQTPALDRIIGEELVGRNPALGQAAVNIRLALSNGEDVCPICGAPATTCPEGA